MNDHKKYLSRCLQIASNGIGYVAPNPMVGCVIVNNGKIIGEGYHKKYGGVHAEVNAINSVKNRELLKSSTLYVNLEPCSHYGKTPPCSHLIIKEKIPEVIIGNLDPNPEVTGGGIKKLKDAGCKVIYNVLSRKSLLLNRRFFTFFEKKRPYIILKWAETPDGFIDIDRNENTKTKPGKVTNDSIKLLVHKWRTEESAIMVGTTTAFMDNPQLNVREWTGRNPIRIVLDQKLKLPSYLHLFDGSTPTIVFTSAEAQSKNNIEYIQIDFYKEITLQICENLYKRKVQSIIIEGGKKLLDTFISDGLWDEARVFIGNKKFNNGILAPKISGQLYPYDLIDNNKLLFYRNITK